MKRRRCVVTGMVALGCLAMVTTELAAGKPVKPPPPPPSCPDCTIAYVQLNTKNYYTRPLMLAKEDGSGSIQLVGANYFEVAEPAWSPDGRWIAFNSRDNTTGELWLNLIRPDGTGPTRIAPRCSFEGRMSIARVQGPSWQPDTDGDGRVWLVYRDGTFPGGVPGENCNPDSSPRWIWAVEVDLAQPSAWNPDETRFAHLSTPDPELWPSWSGYQTVLSGDGSHLAAVQWEEGGITARELMIYDVDFTTGVPQLTNPWSLTPDAANLKGQIYNVAWANGSDTLIVSARADSLDPLDLWMCDVDFGSGTCAGGWNNLTPDSQDALWGACFSSDDSQILVTLKPPSAPSYQPFGHLYVGPFVPFAPLGLQLLIAAPKGTLLIQPDWRALPAP